MPAPLTLSLSKGEQAWRCWRPATLLAILVLALGGAAAVQAHAVLVRSDPSMGAVLDAAPPQVQLWFSEPVEAGFSEIQVLDASRRRVDRGDSRVAPGDAASMVISLPSLDKGTYNVAWKALSSVDGHLTRGVFTLSIGEPPPAGAGTAEQISEEVPWEALARAGGYLGIAALMGALLFRQFVLPGGRSLSLSKGAGSLPWAGLIIAVLSTFAALILQVVLVGGVGAIAQLLFATRYGTILLARLALLSGMAMLLKGAIGPNSRLDGWLALGTGVGVLFTNSLNSHSAALPDAAVLGILADVVHQLAVCLWVGGLLSFALAAVTLRREPQVLGLVLSRFSSAAVVSVAALIITGTYQAWLHVGSFEALFGAIYGVTLLVKVGLFVILALIGAYNLLVVRPNVAAAHPEPSRREGPSPADGAGSGPAVTLTKTLRAEALLGVLVLTAAGLLTSLPPAKGAYEQIASSRPLVMAAPARDVQVTLTMAPTRPGQSTFTAALEAGGRPLTDARIILTFTYLDEAMGATTLIAEHRGEGRYQVSGSPVGVEGSWQGEVVVQRAGQEDVRTAFRFFLDATGSREIGSASAGPRLPAVTPLSIAGLALIVMAGALVVYVKRSMDLRTPEGAGLVVAGLLVAGLGVFVVLRTQPEPALPADARQVRNPIAPTQESVTRGQETYRMHSCDTCHGAQGRGDGPAAAGLRPRPADFRVHMAAGHTDGELFNWVSNGVEGTAMPAYADRLSEEERWHVINFIKTFAPQTGG